MPESRLAKNSYESFTIPDLKNILDEKNISYKSNASKKELLTLLGDDYEYSNFRVIKSKFRYHDR
ncbi:MULTISPECIES: HeH/LEM domain-containing protein [Enterococcus]|uniref:HeH/LEM domain-containing protein n=1 Tax=Enterococcus TaxID=1350 RepID=UPI001599C15A|nr:HeH/LEM domain-containing protein [Enterococcus hirae]MBE8785356.1 hypothetical protein [Enterococcus hirae]MBE8803863.1 hypothetical protein [Enterococcus hirae]MDU1931404.1 HeH/LEM domain-containing protein [Enterococcus hirae]QKX70595.1 hypothetical protein HU257_02645 [Enterococcus hirae]